VDITIATNLSAIFWACRAAMPHLREGDGGSIINTASVLGLIGSEGYAAYGAAKAGLVALTRQIATEYGPKVRANAIAPGSIVAASVEGQPIPGTAAMSGGELKLPYVGLPRDGITLELKLRGHGTLHAELRDYTQGLPPAANPPRRPADTMPAPISFRADPTVVASGTNVRF
jgi:NAD(P)-dependent dehydrogenase (short-subunit alcohol dehydrogenase family)